MELAILIGLILLNGVFAMSEISLVASKKFKLENSRKKGSSGARAALELMENPTRFLSTVQIGITLIGILLGVYSGENLTGSVERLFLEIEPLQPYAKRLATVIIVVFVTYLSIVLGELLPKRIGMTSPELIISFVAKPMQILSKLTSPFVWLLSISNNFMLKVLGFAGASSDKVSEEEIKSLLRQSVEVGEIQEVEHNIVERVFEMGDRKINSLMTYRGDIVFFKTTDTWDAIRAAIKEEKHSFYPVSDSSNLDDVVGVVQLKDLFFVSGSDGFDIMQYLTKPIFLNENSSAYHVMEKFRAEKLHCGIVVDEYGVTVGIVTMDDLMDALVGDISESHQDDYKITQRDENSWFVDGQYPVVEFLRYFKTYLDYDYSGKFATVAGMIMHETNEIPEIGFKMRHRDLQLEVIDKDGQRIDKILVTRAK